ncbi:MAG: ABC transporter substrate-binding protein, partial [Bacteroidales bacterium]|nr:ABC transporter substrate-binding protein [Bacteroidales bacterium]
MKTLKYSWSMVRCFAAIIMVLLLIFTASPVVAQKTDSAKLEHVTLHLKWMHAFQFAGYYAAQEQGFYKAEGLNVKINPASPEHQPINTVLDGEAQFGVWGSELLNQRLSGQPVVVLSVIFQHSPYVILSRKDRNIRIPSDLIGCTVMAVSGMGDAQFKAILLQEGIDPDIVEVIPASWSMDSIIDGKADAIMSYVTDEPNQMRMRGVEPFIMQPVDYGIDFYGDCLFTTEAEIKKNPKRVAAFRRASLQGWEYAMSHTDEMINLIIAMPGVVER